MKDNALTRAFFWLKSLLIFCNMLDRVLNQILCLFAYFLSTCHADQKKRKRAYNQYVDFDSRLTDHLQLLHSELPPALHGNTLVFYLLQCIIPDHGTQTDDHIHPAHTIRFILWFDFFFCILDQTSQD